MPATFHLEHPPLRTVSLERTKELQQNRTRRFSVSPQLVTPPRPTQALAPNSCPAKLPTDWGLVVGEVDPIDLNFLDIKSDGNITPSEEILGGWNGNLPVEQPLEQDETDDFTFDMPLKTSMFHIMDSWFDNDGGLHREPSIYTTRQSLPRDVTSWYYSPIISPDPAFSFAHILSPKLSQRRNATIRSQRNKLRSSTASGKSDSTSSVSSHELRPGLRKRSTKKRSHRDTTTRQERIKQNSEVRLLPRVPPLPPPFPHNHPLPALPTTLEVETARVAGAGGLNPSPKAPNMTNFATTITTPTSFLPSLAPNVNGGHENSSTAPYSSSSSTSSSTASPIQLTETPRSLSSPSRPKTRPLPTPPVLLQMQTKPSVFVLPTVSPTPTFREMAVLPPKPTYHAHSLTSSNATNSPADFPLLIGMVNNMILA